jgi:hypothetical protein
MSEEYTLADLAADAEVDTSDDGDSGGSDLVELFEFVDDKVGLERMFMQSADLGGGDGSAPAEVPARTDGAGAEGDAGGAGGPELNADNVAQLGKLVIDEFGDVPVSKVVKFAEANPSELNAAIDDQMS